MHHLPYSLLPPQQLPHLGVMQKVVSDEEIDRIKFYEKILDFAPATVLGEHVAPEVEHEVKPRVANIATMPRDENTEWLWQRVCELLAKANYDLFLYDIEFLEDLNYITYHGSENGHYVAHRDVSLYGYRKYDRKISGILMLSDPEEYEGGKLMIDEMGGKKEEDWTHLEMKKGDMAFFDSNFTHCVTPVTSGERHVIVFWAHGQVKI